MQHVVTQTWGFVPRCSTNTKLREQRPGAPDLLVQAAVAGAAEPGLSRGGAEPTRRGGEHREPADPPAGLRPAVCCGALCRASVEGHKRRPDPDREPHRGGVRGADPDGEGAAGRSRRLHPSRQASAGEGTGPGRGHRDRKDRVLAQSPHEFLEETPVPAQEDHRPAADRAADQQHPAGPQTDLMNKSGLFHSQTAGLLVLSENKHVNRHIRVNEPVGELQLLKSATNQHRDSVPRLSSAKCFLVVLFLL